MTISRIFDILENAMEMFPDKKDALAGIENGKWRTYSTQEYARRI